MKLDCIQFNCVSFTASATGGRESLAKSSDGLLEIRLSTPKELGGTGTNPEQLFAAGYSACFLGALKFVASQQKIKLPDDVNIMGHVGIRPIPTGFGIETELQITIPGMAKEEAKALVDKAHIVCPYSNATRGNMKVTLTVL